MHLKHLINAVIAMLLFVLSLQSTQAGDVKSGLNLSSPRLCIVKDLLPFQDVKNGQLSGIVADISLIVSTEMASTFNIIETDNTLDSLKTLRSGQCDASFILVNEYQKEAGLIYSTTINQYPLAVAVLTTMETDLNLNSYREKRFAVDPTHIINTKHFLGDVTVSEMSLETAISAVSMGAIDGLIDVMPLIIATLQKNPKPNMKVIELAVGPLSLKLVMKPNDQALMNQINAIIKTIPTQHIIDIEKNWLAIDYQLRTQNWSKWFLILIPLLFLFVLKAKKNKDTLIEKLNKINLDHTNLQQKLAKLDQQESLGLRFVEVISHEYRTPVSVISTNADILELKNNQGDLGLSGQITKIRDAVTRLISIVETTLDRESLASENMIANMAQFDFMQCLNQVVTELDHTYTNRIVSIKAKSENIPYFGDQRLVHLMLRNIIENTFKYSPATTPVEINLDLNKTRLQIIVRDRGIGIPNTEIEHIFEKYHRASNTANTQGIGVGLYLTKSIVIQHHGEISVHCPDDGGTEVLIVLPVDHSNKSKGS